MSLSFFSNSGNSYGSSVPFQRVIEPAQLGMFLNLEQAELLRIQRINEGWRFFLGKQWIFDREDGEPLVTINIAKLIVNKSVDWLVKNGFDIEIPEALKNVTGPLLNEVWEYNNKDQFLYLAGQTGAITGDVFALVTYAEPTETARRSNPNSQGAVKIDLLASEQVYASWDPLDTDVLTSVRIETIYYDDRNQTNNTDRDDRTSHQGRQLYVKRFSQIITPDHIIEQYEGGQPVIKENILGEIPVVHIRNLPLAKEFYGLSDLIDVIDLQREINEKSTDISDIINYHAAPVTVIQGAKASQLERGARQIWSGAPADAKIYNLELQSDLTSSQTYLEYIKSSALEVGEIPSVLLETPSISNTSGVALHLQYQPIVDKTKRKLPFYEKGFEQINYFVLRIASVLGLVNLPFDLCSTCGGRIVEVLDESGVAPRVVKRCFEINKDDLSWKTPEQKEVTYIRQNSMGDEVREDAFGDVKEQHGKKNSSYWDPEKEETQQEYEDNKRAEMDALKNATEDAGQPQTDAEGREIASKPLKTPQVKAEPPKLMGDIQLPNEPEEVMLSTVFTDSSTGETIKTTQQKVLLIPTGCKNPQYLDPYSTKVKFKDALPRDHALDFGLYRDLKKEGIVSKKWIRRKLNIIPPEEYDLIEKEIQEEESQDVRPGGSTVAETAGFERQLEPPRPSELDRAQGEGFEQDRNV